MVFFHSWRRQSDEDFPTTTHRRRDEGRQLLHSSKAVCKSDSTKSTLLFPKTIESNVAECFTRPHDRGKNVKTVFSDQIT